MNTINLGPLAISVELLLFSTAIYISLFVARRAGRAHQINVEPPLWYALFWGLLAARLSFVAFYFSQYQTSPLGILDIRDGGFFSAAGVAVLLLSIGWQARQYAHLRKPLFLAITTGLSIWLGGTYIAQQLTIATPIPTLNLSSVEGKVISLPDLQGKPLVINLWASWCPPCRREMPVLRDAQQNNTEVIFLFVNQGESADVIRNYLDGSQLTLSNVLLDPGMKLSQATGTLAYPTTLFFNAQGQLIERRSGELSAATLTRSLDSLVKSAPRQPAK